MPWIAALGGLALAGAGQAAASSDRNAQLSASQNALKSWLDVNVPDPAQQRVILQQFQQTGTLSPQIEQAIKQDPSAFNKITLDPRLQESQMRALGSLEDLGNKGGQTLNDQAQLQGTLQKGNHLSSGSYYYELAFLNLRSVADLEQFESSRL